MTQNWIDIDGIFTFYEIINYQLDHLMTSIRPAADNDENTVNNLLRMRWTFPVHSTILLIYKISSTECHTPLIPFQSFNLIWILMSHKLQMSCFIIFLINNIRSLPFYSIVLLFTIIYNYMKYFHYFHSLIWYQIIRKWHNQSC